MFGMGTGGTLRLLPPQRENVFKEELGSAVRLPRSRSFQFLCPCEGLNADRDVCKGEVHATSGSGFFQGVSLGRGLCLAQAARLTTVYEGSG